MSVFKWLARIFGRDDAATPPLEENSPQTPTQPTDVPIPQTDNLVSGHVRRHFYNQTGFQTYGSFFTLWDGWATAGHVLSEASDLLPDFCEGPYLSWPDGLDAALIGTTLPAEAPAPPRVGQDIIVKGFPAGSRHLEERRASAYYEREGGVWIAHILTPDEPVVTGMSGGVVIDAASGEPIGILITRNSPADLNADRDPDESCDFVALSAVWDAVKRGPLVA